MRLVALLALLAAGCGGTTAAAADHSGVACVCDVDAGTQTAWCDDPAVAQVYTAVQTWDCPSTDAGITPGDQNSYCAAVFSDGTRCTGRLQ